MLETEDDSDGTWREEVDFDGSGGVEEEDFGRSFGLRYAGVEES